MPFDIQNFISNLIKQEKSGAKNSVDINTLLQQAISSQTQPSYIQTSGTIFTVNSQNNMVQTLYDSDGTRMETRSYDQNGELDRVVKDVYDDYGTLKERLIYDEDGKYTGKMSFESDPLTGVNKTISTDAYGNITDILESKQNPDGSKSSISRDAYGNILSASKLEERNGKTIMTIFDSSGKRTGRQISRNGEVVQTINYSYNQAGKLDKSVYRDSEGELQRTLYFSYNSDGQIEKTTHRDAFGRTVEVLESTYNADGTRTTVRKNAEGEILETTTFDKYGNQIEEI